MYMGRKARIRSSTGIYHIITRGISKQVLFEDTNDYYYYLHILDKYKTEHDSKLYCYCLMSNHVHLLVHDTNGTIDCLMKQIGVSYAAYYNNKYNRIGTLFQERYKSEPVENERYFKTVLRYILQNPEKAQICPVDIYPWSSYKEYADNIFRITDMAFALSLFSSRQQLIEFVKSTADDICLEHNTRRITDEEATSIIKRELQIKSGTIIQSYNRLERDAALYKLKSLGLTVRQIERLTGINRGVVAKAGKKS